MVKITRFAQSVIDLFSQDEPNCSYWYETVEGIRTPCSKKFIGKLWLVWVCRTDSSREDNKEFTIFKFGEPYEMEKI